MCHPGIDHAAEFRKELDTALGAIERWLPVAKQIAGLLAPPSVPVAPAKRAKIVAVRR
jgi:hypothetical protein